MAQRNALCSVLAMKSLKCGEKSEAPREDSKTTSRCVTELARIDQVTARTRFERPPAQLTKANLHRKLLWHLSSVWVTFRAAFWLLIHLLAYFLPDIDRIWIAYNERRLGWFATGIITLLCVLCGVSFIWSRAFLVVEAFVSIRMVPKAVYDTPSWSQVFPHL